ncbi:MAG: DUF2080 family transposase-associated protein [Candidatus Woesearchaeota archaeon]
MSSLKEKNKKPGKLVLKQVDLEDVEIKKVHKSGNKDRVYGRIYLPKEWIGKKVYVGLKNERSKK